MKTFRIVPDPRVLAHRHELEWLSRNADNAATLLWEARFHAARSTR